MHNIMGTHYHMHVCKYLDIVSTTFISFSVLSTVCVFVCI